MQNNDKEEVVLVDEDDKPIGVIKKSLVHHANTPLHRGFSVFVFNSKKEFLLQKRNSNKKTWGGFWSNSFCGHPMPGETYEVAANRRGYFELGIKLNKLIHISNYRYSFAYNNIVENEICPIYFSIFNDPLDIKANLTEVESTKWVNWDEFLIDVQDVQKNCSLYTPWCIEEARILSNNSIFNKQLSDLK